MLLLSLITSGYKIDILSSLSTSTVSWISLWKLFSFDRIYLFQSAFIKQRYCRPFKINHKYIDRYRAQRRPQRTSVILSIISIISWKMNIFAAQIKQFVCKNVHFSFGFIFRMMELLLFKVFMVGFER